MGTTSKQSRQMRSTEERSALLALYRQSGISQKQWCEENHISLSSLRRWLNREKKHTGKGTAQTWAPVEIIPREKESVLTLQSGKFTIAVDKGTDMKLLTFVLKALADLC